MAMAMAMAMAMVMAMAITDRPDIVSPGSNRENIDTIGVATRKDAVRIMIVDDDPAILAAVTDWLQARCAAVVLAFHSAEEAMVAAEPGSFDVCILDYRLAGADGLTLGAMLREINPEAQLILLSGELSATVESLAFEHGFGRVFTKPIAPEALIDAIVD